MIPKIIHFCWMSGDPYPEEIQKCIDSWHKILPDYEFWLWDSNRFDMESSVWVKEAYAARKYAFCADYIRCFALYTYGGIYLDSDVEVLKSFNDLLHLPYFIGMESAGHFEAATMGSEKGHPLFGKMLEHYKDRHFLDKNGEPDIVIIPKIMTEIARTDFRLVPIERIEDFDYSPDVISVFPYDYFSPIDTRGKRYVLRQTINTYSIHHFASAWVSWQIKLLVWLFGNTKTMLRVKSALSFLQKNLYKKTAAYIRQLKNKH